METKIFKVRLRLTVSAEHTVESISSHVQKALRTESIQISSALIEDVSPKPVEEAYFFDAIQKTVGGITLHKLCAATGYTYAQGQSLVVKLLREAKIRQLHRKGKPPMYAAVEHK